MFNYLEVAQNIIGIVIKDINKTKYGEEVLEPTTGTEPDSKEIEQ